MALKKNWTVLFLSIISLFSGCMTSDSFPAVIKSLPNGSNLTFDHDFESDGIIFFNGCNATAKEDVTIMANCRKGCVYVENGTVVKSKCFDDKRWAVLGSDC
jgi:hypothetical protein